MYASRKGRESAETKTGTEAASYSALYGLDRKGITRF